MSLDPTGITTLVQAVCQAIAAAFTFATSRSNLKNTAAMQANATAVSEQQARDKTTNDIKERNTNEIRKDLAE